MKFWITLNEPKEQSLNGYGTGYNAPGINDGVGTKAYVAAHNAIRAHAYAYRVYEAELKQEQQGGMHLSYVLF